MSKIIWRSWFYSVLSADILCSIILFFIILPELDELFWYMLRGVLFMTLTLPIPILLDLFDRKNIDWSNYDRYEIIKQNHLNFTLIVMFIEAILISILMGGPTSWGDFTIIIFLGVIFLYLIYGIFSSLVWRIINKEIS